MFIIFCRTDGTTAPADHKYRKRYPDGRIPGRFEQATRQTFANLADAKNYAASYNYSRDAFVLDLDPTGYGQMYAINPNLDQLRDNSARLAHARELQIDW